MKRPWQYTAGLKVKEVTYLAQGHLQHLNLNMLKRMYFHEKESGNTCYIGGDISLFVSVKLKGAS